MTEEALDLAVGRTIQQLRSEMGMSQSDLAARLGAAGLKLRQQTVATIESGTRPLKLSEAIVIAEVLGVKVEQLSEPDPVAVYARNLKRYIQEVDDSEVAMKAAIRTYADARAQLTSRIGEVMNAVAERVLVDGEPVIRGKNPEWLSAYEFPLLTSGFREAASIQDRKPREAAIAAVDHVFDTIERPSDGSDT